MIRTHDLVDISLMLYQLSYQSSSRGSEFWEYTNLISFTLAQAVYVFIGGKDTSIFTNTRGDKYLN